MTGGLAVRRYVAETLGTFVLVAIGPGAAMVADKTHAFGHEGVALAFGLAVALRVAAFGHLSGAHINPAVTIGFWSVRRFPAREVLPYIIAQSVGAIAASALLVWLLGPVGNFGATLPGIGLLGSFAVEAAYSGLLAFVIMAVATDERSPAPLAVPGPGPRASQPTGAPSADRAERTVRHRSSRCEPCTA